MANATTLKVTQSEKPGFSLVEDWGTPLYHDVVPFITALFPTKFPEIYRENISLLLKISPTSQRPKENPENAEP